MNNLTTVLEQLESSNAGRPIAQAIRQRGTSVKFRPLKEGVVAQFAVETNEITISDEQADAPSAVLCAHLAHEGVHAGWDRDYR